MGDYGSVPDKKWCWIGLKGRQWMQKQMDGLEIYLGNSYKTVVEWWNVNLRSGTIFFIILFSVWKDHCLAAGRFTIKNH